MPARHVLVVEDSRTQATRARMVLEDAGYLVTVAADGDIAWALLVAHPFDVIVSDINMPGIDGYELCRRSKEDARIKTVPFILLTAEEDLAALVRGLEAGADDFIAKPWMPEALTGRIAKVLQEPGHAAGAKEGASLERMTGLLLGRTLELEQAHRELAEHGVQLSAANEAAATHLASLTAIIDSIGEGVVLLDGKHVAVHWNNEASRMTGIPAVQVLGRRLGEIAEMLRPLVEDFPALQSHLERATRLPLETTPFPMVVAETHMEVEIALSPALLAFDQSHVGLVIVLRDVTAQKELERAKAEFTAMVSHELRTPLVGIVGFSELLLSREFSEAQNKQYLETVLHEGQRLTSLINDFLDLQKLERGYNPIDLGPCDLKAIIDRAVTQAGDDPKSPIQVDLSEDLPLVLADANAIGQVMLNLLANARKFSPAGGAIQVVAARAGDTVEVSIQDHGIGISAGELSKLFTRFYRVASTDRRVVRGVGLGLAVSRRIVDAHGGKIGVDSGGLDQGSRFRFTLRSAGAIPKVGDVLIVEDDSGFARLVEAELSTRGIGAVWAPDAETAARLIRQVTPRAVVLDLRLPGIQGEDFLSTLRQTLGPEVVVAVVTLKELDSAETLALRTLGVTWVLKKHAGAAKEAANLIAETLLAAA